MNRLGKDMEAGATARCIALASELALIPSLSGDEAEIRGVVLKHLDHAGKEAWTDGSGNVLSSSGGKEKILLCAHMDKQAPPAFSMDRDKGILAGKLDDAIGMAMIMALLDRHEAKGAFTVQEETGKAGAKHIVKREKEFLQGIEHVVVVDMSPVDPPGINLYHSYHGIPPRPISRVAMQIAEAEGIELRSMPAMTNDGTVFSKEIRSTIAIEPCIGNFHTSAEITRMIDVDGALAILDGILTHHLSMKA